MTTRHFALGEICSFVGGGTPSRKTPEYFTGDIPWATVKDFKSLTIVDTEEHITEEALKNSASNIVNAGTVLLVTRVGLGKVAIAGTRLAINQDIKAVLPNNDDVQPEYLFWFLLSQASRIQAMGTGATVKGVTLKDVRALRVPVPPLDEQRRIVDLLSRAEGIVRLRREAQAKASQLTPALFVDMFGDPATNPMDWPELAMKEVASIGSGAGFPIKEQGRKIGEYPFYKVGDMNLPGNEEVMSSSRNYIEDSTRRKLRAKTFPAGTVIFPKIGAAIATNKKRVLSMPSCVDNNVMAIVPSDRLAPAYLQGLLLLSDLSRFASDSNPPSIRKTTVEDWRIPLPPLAAQVQFSARAKTVRTISDQQATASTIAEASLESLLHQYFFTI